MRSPSAPFLGIVVAACLVPMAAGTALAKRPSVKSKAAVAIDAETGAEVFGKSADEVRPIASTTKICVEGIRQAARACDRKRIAR
ncbi:MAG TPA: hypothetical protein PLF40_30230, partial [Kofleriaceae bacterium]|nr:hypothetical protein [Kofleriaceae bacterium]